MIWQTVLVGIIVLVCFAFVIRSIYRFIKKANDKNINPCENCVSDCKLKDMAVKRSLGCDKKEKKSEKSSEK